jgi:hypothetical protein
MKFLIAAAVVATTIAGFGASANAAQGCGPGFQRGPYGACVRSAVVVRRAPVVVVRRAPVVVVRRDPVVVVRRAPVVVVQRARVCPYGMVWRYGRCRY